MSYWTHIRGTLQVLPMGRTQEELEYILKTVLNHLPSVSGSEGDMSVHVVQMSGHNCSSNTDEFGQWTTQIKNSLIPLISAGQLLKIRFLKMQKHIL